MKPYPNQRKLLVTIALPYANGDIHLGHLVEATQADIWVRHHRMQGNTCHFICGSDAHGTSIMLSAEKQGVTPQQQIDRIHSAHHRDYQEFGVNFDCFYTTHSKENEKLCQQIYQQLVTNGDITQREISQAFDPQKLLFLADRFIRGECPCCNATDQYGDNCEACGATYQPNQLKNPRSTLSGATPIEKKSKHYFFQISRYQELLNAWVNHDHLQPQMVNKLKEWLQAGLKDWDISRDAPYFGFEIPNAPGKYFYVWLDAPVGYMASFQKLCEQRQDIRFNDYWQPNTDTELYHFIGKDIVYFHALFWPAMLHGSGYRLPNYIFVHGFLTVNGHKMSKSRGTFITAQQYLKTLKPEYLRYYFATKFTGQVEDIDLNWHDFMTRINADLIGKYVNLASRCAGFITKQFGGQLTERLDDETLFNECVNAGVTILDSYTSLNTNRAIRDIMKMADRANQYIDHHKPWALAKQVGCEADVQRICTQGINLFRLLTLYLKPILPDTAKRAEDFLNIPALQWQDRSTPLLNHRINKFTPLMQRITSDDLAQLKHNDN